MMLRTPSRARRPASVVVKAAILMPVLLAVVALALDTGMVYDRQRHTQAAADAAALAAAGDLFLTYTDGDYNNNGTDANKVAHDHAKAVAKANGYPDDGVTAKVDVLIPPQTGPFAGQVGYVEVVITYYQARGFSTIFGTGDLKVGARAVARGRWQPANVGIICLDPGSNSSLKLGGGATANVPNSAVIVNSTGSTAMYSSGEGNKIVSESFEITGGYGGGTVGVNFVGPIETGVPPTPDPYRFLPAPDKSTMPQQSLQTAEVINHGEGYRTFILKPGVYQGGLSFSAKDSVIMQPGIYYMENGGFSFSGQGSLTALEVMVYNETNATSQAIKITGQGAVTWTPPASGTYKGITLFQERGSDVPLAISGGGAMNISGVLYAPDALVDVSGTGTNYIGNQVVCWQMNFQGNGVFNVPWDPGQLPNIRDLRIVE